MMQVYDAFNDSKPDSAAGHTVLQSAIKSIENALPFRQRNPRTGISHFKYARFPLGKDIDVNFFTCRNITDTVVNQIDQQRSQRIPVAIYMGTTDTCQSQVYIF